MAQADSWHFIPSVTKSCMDFIIFCQPAWLSCACSWPASFYLPTLIPGAGSHLAKGTSVIVPLHPCSLAPLQQGWIQHGWDVFWRVFLW